MPSPRAILRVPRAVFFALIRFLRTIVVIGFATFALALLLLRFVLLPQVENYREALAGLLSRQLGQPIEIAVLTTGFTCPSHFHAGSSCRSSTATGS